eukprot:353287-Prymnesium_polylepis.2
MRPASAPSRRRASAAAPSRHAASPRGPRHAVCSAMPCAAPCRVRRHAAVALQRTARHRVHASPTATVAGNRCNRCNASPTALATERAPRLRTARAVMCAATTAATPHPTCSSVCGAGVARGPTGAGAVSVGALRRKGAERRAGGQAARGRRQPP